MIDCAFFAILRWPGNDGEDIVNARENFLSENRNDFWGGVSSLFYGNLPNSPIEWQSYLTLIQLLLALIGCLRISTEIPTKRTVGISFLLISHIVFSLSVQNTRDGIMTALTVLGIGELFKQKNKVNFPGVLVLLIAASFRPWLSIAFAILILYFMQTTRRKITSIILVLTFSAVPIILDRTIVEVGNFAAAYPQQQVMLMDSASILCSTTNANTSLLARDTLEFFVKSENFETVLCQFYKADTWVSLSKSQTITSENLEMEISLIRPKDERSYKEVKKLWLELLVSDPISYVQVKLNQLTRVIIAGDMRNIRLVTELNKFELPIRDRLFSLLMFPYDVAISFHLLSMFSITIYLIIYFIRTRGNKTVQEVINDRFFQFILVFFLAWLTFSLISYIGNNGRYTYLSSIIILLSIFNDRKIHDQK